jgi:hypothetical protein
VAEHVSCGQADLSELRPYHRDSIFYDGTVSPMDTQGRTRLENAGMRRRAPVPMADSYPSILLVGRDA